MADNNNTNNNSKPLAEINVTPFVDVMTTLLIIFMITAPLMQHGLDVNLPQAKAPVMEKSDKDFVLTIKKDGSIFLADDPTPVTLGFLEHKLSTIYETKEKKDLYIKADEDVVYGRVVSIMATAKAAGVERIGMITQPEKAPKDDKDKKDKDDTAEKISTKGSGNS